MITLRVPGSKSITNRALLLAALASGESTLKGFLQSDDTEHMIASLKKLGVHVIIKGNIILVSGSGLGKTRSPLFCGNAGTVMRFLGAVLATQSFTSILDGDAQMQNRPIGDLLSTLSQLGARAVSLKKNDCPPIQVAGPLGGGSCIVRGDVSSQFLSGLLMAAPLAQKDVEIRVRGSLVSKPYVDLTIDLMKKFGVTVQRNGYKTFFIKAGQPYCSRQFEIEADASSASYFVGLSVLTGENSKIENAPAARSLQADQKFSTVALQMKPLHSELHLRPLGTIDCSDFPDCAMTLAVLCAFAKGKSVLTGLSNLRVKECDRLHALVQGLKKIGCRAREMKDGLEINGDPEKLHSGRIKTYGDHRMAMCFGMAGAVIRDVTVDNPNCVSKTYPNFWRDLQRIKNQLCKKNIVLTGMRGSGKSEIGKMLAKNLCRRFFDLDEVIVKMAGKPIHAVVAEKGWDYFRTLERKAVQRVSRFKKAVIATGGGTVIDPRNETVLKKNGVVLLLFCPVSVLKKRLNTAKNRPSLTGTNFLQELAVVYKKREKRYYAAADATLDVSQDSKNKHKDLQKKVERLQSVIVRLGLL